MAQQLQNNKFICIKIKCPPRAFPGFHLVQYGLQSAIQKEIPKELTDNADFDALRGFNGQPHIVLFKEENVTLQLKDLCCKPELISEILEEGEVAGKEGTNQFYEKMEPIFIARHPLGEAKEVISNLEKGHFPFACVVHLETEIYTDEKELSLRMRINSKNTDILALFQELSVQTINARFSLNIKNEKLYEHLEMHEKIRMAADMLGETLCIHKIPEFLDDRIFCVLDDFLGESLSKHLEDQLFYSMQKTQKFILEKLNMTAELFDRITTELVRCENADKDIMHKVLENCEEKFKVSADNFKYPKTECNENGKQEEIKSASALEYEKKMVKHLSMCLVEEIVQLLRNRYDNIYTAICVKHGWMMCDNFLQEEKDGLIPGSTPERYEQMTLSVKKHLEQCLSANTSHFKQIDANSKRWKCQESEMLYEMLRKHKATQTEIIKLFQVGNKTASKKLNNAYDAMENLQDKVNDLRLEMKATIPLSLQMIARRLPPVKGIAKIQGNLRILVESKILEDKTKRQEILKIVSQYNKGHFRDVTDANFMKYYGKGIRHVRQGSKIIRHDDRATRYGTLACLGKMNGDYDVGITNDHVALPGSMLYANEDDEEIPLGMASGEYNIDMTVKFRRRMIDFSAFKIEKGISLERHFFTKTHDIAASQVFRTTFDKVASKPRPSLYLFGGTSVEPKLVEYEGSLTTNDRQVDLVKAIGDSLPEGGDSGSLICHFDENNSTVQAMFIFIGKFSDEANMYQCCRLSDCLDYLKHYRHADITFSSPSGSNLRVLSPRH